MFGFSPLDGNEDSDLARVRRFVVVAGLVASLSGCALSFDASTLGVRATLAEPAGSAPPGAEFRVNKKAVFLFFGILRAATPSLENVLAGQLVDGSEINNLSIGVRSGFGDILLTILTAGLVVPRTVTFTGTVAPPGN